MLYSFRGLALFTKIRLFRVKSIEVLIKSNMPHSQVIDENFISSIFSILWDLLFNIISNVFQK